VASKPIILIFIHLAQDLDIVLPLLKILRNNAHNISLKVCITYWVADKSPRIIKTLDWLEIDYCIVSRCSVKLGIQPSLKGVQALITAAETTSNAHVCAYKLTKRANKFGILTYTLQHGFENIGLTYSDEIHSTKSIDFAAQKILIWGQLNTLLPTVSPEIKSRCVPIGYLKEITPITIELKNIPKRKYLIAIFENLHWHRYNDEYRNHFLEALEKAAIQFSDTTFLVKPHHAGQWLTDNCKYCLQHLENLIIADPSDPQWEPFTATSILPLVDGAITTPSTVALDAAQLNIPVAVTGWGLNLSNYQPLFIINSFPDWINFIHSLRSDAGKLANQQQGSAFIKKNILPGNTVDRMIALITTDIATRQDRNRDR
jgi:hypothetical protein